MGTCLSIIKIGDDTSDSINTTTHNVNYKVTWSDHTATTYDVRMASIPSLDPITHAPILDIHDVPVILSKIPDRNTAPPYTGLVLTNRHVTRDTSTNDPSVFLVTCQWDSLTPGNEPAKTDGPWNIQFSADGVMYLEPLTKDFSGTPKEIRLLDGSPIEPEVMAEYWDSEYTLSYRAPTAGFNCDAIDALRGMLNSDAITMNLKGVARAFKVGTLKCVKASYSLGMQEGAFFWQVALQFQHRKFIMIGTTQRDTNTWSTLVQSRSYDVRNADNTKQRQTTQHQNPPYSANGEPMCQPMFHTADGKDWVDVGGALPPPMEFVNLKSVAFSSVLTGISTV